MSNQGLKFKKLIMTQKYIQSSLQETKVSGKKEVTPPVDAAFEVPLRPQSLDDFSGQDQIKERLDVLIKAAKGRNEPLTHCLFSGPPGLGKTTLANILARAMGTNLVVTSGAIIEKPGDLAGVLTGLQEGDVLFIDEIHRLNRNVEEYLYPAIEDFTLDLMIDSGPSARSIQVPLKRFTLAGATTRAGLLTAPLRSRFGFTCRLDYYPVEVLETILQRTALMLKMNIDGKGLREIAKRSRGTPRIANNYLRWVRDYGQIKANGIIDSVVVNSALDMLKIDEKGLDEMDKRILETMIEHYDGGPVGISTIAIAVGEEASTIEEVYEPYLIMQGFIKRTPRGREVTDLGYRHMVAAKA
jgi:Holliday junction DNA helicase RuvB